MPSTLPSPPPPPVLPLCCARSNCRGQPDVPGRWSPAQPGRWSPAQHRPAQQPFSSAAAAVWRRMFTRPRPKIEGRVATDAPVSCAGAHNACDAPDFHPNGEGGSCACGREVGTRGDRRTIDAAGRRGVAASRARRTSNPLLHTETESNRHWTQVTSIRSAVVVGAAGTVCAATVRTPLRCAALAGQPGREDGDCDPVAWVLSRMASFVTLERPCPWRSVRTRETRCPSALPSLPGELGDTQGGRGKTGEERAGSQPFFCELRIASNRTNRIAASQ